MIYNRWRVFYHPERFQGWGRNTNYFEGWYYKIITCSGKEAYAIIPGVSFGPNGESHCFIQILDGIRGTAANYHFPIKEFETSSNKFEVRIGKNRFSRDFVELNLSSVYGSLTFEGGKAWPVKWYSPGIMGPYAFAPFMECYHGVISMDHQINGELTVEGRQLDFTNGRGYIEKDWGSSFPKAYFWMQSNHFSRTGISCKLSVAHIPWLGKSFVGFIGGLLIDDKLYRFTTYNGTKLIRSFADQHQVEVVLQNKLYRFEVVAIRDKATSLASPILGLMDGRIEESMTSVINIRLVDRKTNQILIQDQGSHCALEVAGQIDEILIC